MGGVWGLAASFLVGIARGIFGSSTELLGIFMSLLSFQVLGALLSGANKPQKI